MNLNGLLFGLMMLALAVVLALAVDNVLIRYPGALIAAAIGLSALRRASRIE